MSRLPLVEPEQLPPYLKAVHDHTPPENAVARNFARAFAPHPELVQAYQGFYGPWHTGGAGLLPSRLKELVRLRIATLNGCVLCKTVRMAPDVVSEAEAAAGVDSAADAEGFSARERAAIRFAEMMALSHHDINDDDVAEMRGHFSDAEFLELAMMTGQYIGFGRVLAMLQLEIASCPI